MAEAAGIDAVGRQRAFGRLHAAVSGRGLLARLRIEVAHERGAMVLRDERDERLRQLGPIGDIDAVGDMRLQDLRRHLGRQLVVDVLTALVLDEPKRIVQLADVVVVGRDARL